MSLGDSMDLGTIPDHLFVPCPLCEVPLRVDLAVSTDIEPGPGPGGSGRMVTVKVRQALIRRHACDRRPSDG